MGGVRPYMAGEEGRQEERLRSPWGCTKWKVSAVAPLGQPQDELLGKQRIVFNSLPF